MPSVYAFDAYGTLFDVHSAVRRHGDAVGPDAMRVSEIWRNKQLEYSWVRTLAGRYVDFWTITEQALDFALTAVPSANRSARNDLLDAYWSLECYAEVADVLGRLRASGAKTAILSNGSPQMLEAAVTNADLGDLLDATISVDSIRQFKVVPAAYQLVCDAFGCLPADISFQSSNRWDIAGATASDWSCVWVNRTNQPDEYTDLPPVKTVSDLRGLL